MKPNLDIDSHTPFQRKVLSEARKIPRGKVISYKSLAARVGLKSGARAVGNVMAKNPHPIVIPCHRVVGCDGRIGGFQSGWRLKKRLLMAEGVAFDKKGRIPEEFFLTKKRKRKS